MERTARMQSPLHRTDARSKLLVTVVFLVTMLSVPLCRLPELLLFFVFPIVACAMGGLSYGTIFRRSLVVLPFVAFIGVQYAYVVCPVNGVKVRPVGRHK